MTTAEEENASKVSKGPGVGLRSDLQELLDRCKGKLSHAQALDVVRFLHKCRHLFAPWNFVLGRTAVVKQRINTGPSENPIKQGARRILLHLLQEVNKQVNGMLKRDVIKPSNSPLASPVDPVRTNGESVLLH